MQEISDYVSDNFRNSIPEFSYYFLLLVCIIKLAKLTGQLILRFAKSFNEAFTVFGRCPALLHVHTTLHSRVTSLVYFFLRFCGEGILSTQSLITSNLKICNRQLSFSDFSSKKYCFFVSICWKEPFLFQEFFNVNSEFFSTSSFVFFCLC